MKEQYIREKVQNYFNKNAQHYISNFVYLSHDDKQHIINIATSILLHKYKIISYTPGGFVDAFLKNDLQQTFAQADNVNTHAIHFYLMLVYNIEL